jgi:hypothetical protein
LIASSQRGQCRRPDGAANLRASDYHKPLPDNSGHARTVSCDHRRCLCPVRTGAGCWRSFRAGKGWRRPWWPFRRRVLGYVARRVDDLASEEAMVRDPGGGVPEVLNETDNSSGAWERSVAANTFRTLMLYPLSYEGLCCTFALDIGRVSPPLGSGSLSRSRRSVPHLCRVPCDQP